MSVPSLLPRLTALAFAALLAACGSLSTPAPPATELPARFAQSSGLPSGERPGGAAAMALGDPVLATLLQRGLAANLDLAQAAERVQGARALAAGRRAESGPAGGARLGARAQQASRSEAPGLSGDERRSEQVSAGVDFAWEIDLFGRLRRQAGAADARVRVGAAEAEALRLAVAAEIAQAWFDYAGELEQLRLTRGVIENRRATLQLVQRRTAAGYSAALDDARAHAELAAAEAELPQHEAAATVAVNRLAVLLGESPSSFEPPQPIRAEPAPLELSVPAPSHWLAARPDVRAAEAALQAEALDVQAVRAEFLPRLSIGGVLGFVAGSAAGLGAAGSASWFVAPSLSVPVLDRGRIDARLAAAQARQREALLAYRQRVLLALEEVESSLARVRHDQGRLAALQQGARHALVAEGLARRRFEAGASDLLELLDAQRGAQQAELGLAAALTRQRRQIVALLRAFGTEAATAEA